MNHPEDKGPHSPLALSMLISEAVYRLVLLVESLIRWVAKSVLHPCRLQCRCFFW